MKASIVQPLWLGLFVPDFSLNDEKSNPLQPGIDRQGIRFHQAAGRGLHFPFRVRKIRSSLEPLTTKSHHLLSSNLLVILGPTASGKTTLAVRLAERLNGEIISADSRQVFRGMDLGTGKDLQEYGTIPYHLIDIVEPGTEFSVFHFQQHFAAAFTDIQQRQRLPILAGGSGLYLEAALRGYRFVEVPENPELRKTLGQCSDEELQSRLLQNRPDLHNTTDINERQRLIRAIEIAEGEKEASHRSVDLPDLSPFIIGIHWERSILRQRITQRLRQRLEQGMIDEVRTLLDQGVPPQMLDFYGLEYRFLSQFIAGELSRNDMFQKLNSAIHQFAKRQDTWFRRMERQGLKIHWVEGGDQPLETSLDLLTQNGFIV